MVQEKEQLNFEEIRALGTEIIATRADGRQTDGRTDGQRTLSHSMSSVDIVKKKKKRSSSNERKFTNRRFKIIDDLRSSMAWTFPGSS